MEFLGKVIVLMAAYISPKFQHKPPHLHIYADHPCHGHWCTPILSQKLVFALFVSNSLDGLFHLWHVGSNVRFSKKQPEKWTRLTREHAYTVFQSISDGFGPKELWNVLSENDFSKLLPSPCGYVHHDSMTVSQTISPECSMVTRIQQRFPPLAFTHQDFLNLFMILWTVDVFDLTDNSFTMFGTKWWTTTHPCLPGLSYQLKC